MDILKNILGIGNSIGGFFSKKKKDLEDAFQQFNQPPQRQQAPKLSFQRPTPTPAPKINVTPPKLSFQQPKPAVMPQSRQTVPTQPQTNPLLDFFKNTATKVAQGAGNTVKSLAKELPSTKFGTAVGKTIVRPLDAIQMNRATNADLEEARKMTDLAIKLSAQGKSQEAQKLFQRSRELSQGATKQAKDFGQGNKKLQEDVVKNGVGTILSLLGAGYTAKNLMIPAAGALIGGVSNKLQGKSFAEGAGKGIADSLPMSGVMQFTSPAINAAAPQIAKYVSNPFFRAVAERGLVGAGNVLENRIINTTAGAKSDFSQDVFAFTLGALAHSPGQKINGWVDLPEATKTSIIRIANKAGLDTTPMSWAGDLKWQNTPKFLDDLRFSIKQNGLKKTAEQGLDTAAENINMGLSVKPKGGNKALLSAEKQKETIRLMETPTEKLSLEDKLKKAEIEKSAERGALEIKNEQLTTSRKTAQQIQQEVQSGTYQPRTKKGQAPMETVPPASGAVEQPIEVVTPKVEIPEQQLNVNKLDLTEAQKAEVQTIGAKEVQEKLTNEQIQEIAQSAGIDTKTYNTTQTAEKIAEQLNARRQVVEAEKALTDIKENGGTPEEIEAAIRKVAETAKASASQGTDIARQLQARKILANEIDTPMQRVFKLLESAGVNPEVYIKKAVDVDFKDANQVAKFYRELVPAKFGDWLTALRYNSMLSSPNTHINNIFGNAIGSSMVAPIEKTVRGAVDFLQSAVTGKEREHFVSEGGAYVKGYWSNLGKAAQNFADVMRGVRENKNLDIRDVPLAETGIKGVLAKGLSGPMKLLEAADQFFTALTKGGEEATLNLRKNLGVKVGDIDSEASNAAAYRLFRQDLKAPGQGTMLDGIDEITAKIMSLRGSKNPLVRTIATFTVPFIKTPMNILKQGIEYSPAGVLTAVGAIDPAGQMVKAAMGTAGVLGAMTMLGSGRLTWAQPTSEKEKQAFIAAGMQPYSVKVGNNWVSFSKLPPVMSFNLALVAAIDDALNKKSITDDDASAIMDGIAKWGNFFADQSYVKNVGDLIATAKGDVESVSRFISNYPQQLVPYRALGGWLARLTDPLQRQTPKDAGFWDKQVMELMKNIPGLSQAVPARLDANGMPIENQNRVLNAFSPLKITTERPTEKMTYDTIVAQNKAKKEIRDLKTGGKANLEKTGVMSKVGAGSGIELSEGIEGSLDAVFGVQALEKMPETTNYEKAKKSTAAKGLLDKVLKDETIDEETKMAYLAKKTGLPEEDIQYYSVSKASTEEKYAYIQDGIQNLEGAELIDYLKEARKEVMGEMILSNAVIDNLVDDGTITKSMGSQLKKFTLTADGGKIKGGTGGGLTKSKLQTMINKAKAYGKQFDIGKPPEIDTTIESKGSTTKPVKVPKMELSADFFTSSAKVPKAPTLEEIFQKTKVKIPTTNIAKARALIDRARSGGQGNTKIKLSQSFFRGNRKA